MINAAILWVLAVMGMQSRWARTDWQSRPALASPPQPMPDRTIALASWNEKREHLQ
jgi:hypothetical protein